MLNQKLTGQQAADKTYIEDVFSTYLYTGNGSTQRINNGIQLGDSFSSGSGYFDGNSKVRSSSFPSISAGEDFTVEAFIYQTQQTSGGLQCISTPRISSGSWYFGIYLNNIFFYDESASTFSGTAVTPNTWIHAAYSRSGTTHRLFLNGVLVGTKTATAQAETGGALAIGSDDSSSTSIVAPFYGYISNLRVVKGTALYTANFTAPTAELTAVSGTSILCLQGTTPFIDKSTNSYTLTVSGNTKADVFGPFSVAGYGKGGMVWLKGRSGATDHALYDTVRGATKDLVSNSTAAETTQSTGLTAFNSNGFNTGALAKLNTSAATYASWTFRKAPKFFDVVTYTGDGVAGRTVSHNLGQEPGMVIVKATNNTGTWYVYHKSMGGTQYGKLEETGAFSSGAGVWSNTNPTSSVFTTGSVTNYSGYTYVAYLFAHDTTTDGLIQCGSYTGNGIVAGPTVSLGWEPQYLMIKKSSSTGNWQILDNMRGMPVGSTEATLQANLSNAESSIDYVSPTATGFQVTSTNTEVNSSGATYIYMAIRRGPMRTPTDATKVFYPQAVAQTDIQQTSNSPLYPDLIIDSSRNGSSSAYRDSVGTRLIGLGSPNDTFSTQLNPILYTNSTSAETTNGYIQLKGDSKNVTKGAGWNSASYGNFIYWLFSRAPGFFDVVCYTGTGVAMTVNHNLGVVPELIICKSRSGVFNWRVYAAPIGATKALTLSSNAQEIVTSVYWNDTTPTSTAFSIGTSSNINNSGANYVAYLFASCPGVSKVGSYTGNGTSQTINCGFTNGSRFVLIKRTDSTGDWYVWDTARGIVAANDPRLSLNTIDAEVTTDDTVDPNSTGFIVNQITATNVNVSGGSYIYLAIA